MRINVPFRSDRQPLGDVAKEEAERNKWDNIVNREFGKAEKNQQGSSLGMQRRYENPSTIPNPNPPNRRRNGQNEIPTYSNQVNHFA